MHWSHNQWVTPVAFSYSYGWNIGSCIRFGYRLGGGRCFYVTALLLSSPLETIICDYCFLTATIWYMGHSEEGTGDWCFKDGTISFQELFDLYMTHLPGRLLTIVSDCCYSGNWVHRCAETLDNKLGIRPCGHKARERGVLIKVCASCQGNQKAAEPCFSTDATHVDANSDTLKSRRNPQLTEHQTTMVADFTQLVCCREPWSLCPADDAFKNWKWYNAVSGEMRRNIHPVRGNDEGRPAWHYVLLSSGDEEHVQGFKEQNRTGTIDVADWGYAIESGWGEDPPDNNRDKVRNWTWVCQWFLSTFSYTFVHSIAKDIVMWNSHADVSSFNTYMLYN